MKVFLSWSGNRSKKIAEIFCDWIPCVVQSTEVFLSSEAIAAGELWHSKISSALDEIDFGVVFVTKANSSAPWLLFESGALSKKVGSARVIPILCDEMSSVEELEFKKNPLSHFQYAKIDEDGMRRLVRSIYSSSDDCTLTDTNFEKSLVHWMPELMQELSQVPADAQRGSKKATSEDDRLQALESGLTDLIGMVRHISSSVAIPKSGNALAAGYSSDKIDFTLPIDEFLSKRYISGTLARKAKTKEELKMVIRYLKENKNPQIVRKLVPGLERKLNELEESDNNK